MDYLLGVRLHRRQTEERQNPFNHAETPLAHHGVSEKPTRSVSTGASFSSLSVKRGAGNRYKCCRRVEITLWETSPDDDTSGSGSLGGLVGEQTPAPLMSSSPPLRTEGRMDGCWSLEAHKRPSSLSGGKAHTNVRNCSLSLGARLVDTKT